MIYLNVLSGHEVTVLNILVHLFCLLSFTFDLHRDLEMQRQTTTLDLHLQRVQFDPEAGHM